MQIAAKAVEEQSIRGRTQRTAREIVCLCGSVVVKIWRATTSVHASHDIDKYAYRPCQTIVENTLEGSELADATVHKACMRFGVCGRATSNPRKSASERKNEFTVPDALATTKHLEKEIESFETSPSPTNGYESRAFMICKYARQGRASEALSVFQQMEREDIPANSTILASILKACGSMQALDQGRHVHALLNQRGLRLNVIVGTSLIDMYMKCGSLNEARSVFNYLCERNVVTWTVMIAGCALHGNGHEALHLYRQMHQTGLKPNRVTFLSVLKACGSVGALDEGQQVHAQLSSSGCEVDVVVGSALVNMYAKCGAMRDAQKLFEKLPEKNVVSWTAMIAGYAQHGRGQQALELYSRMQQEGLRPNKITFVAILRACTDMGALLEGRRIHVQLRETGCLLDPTIGNALLNMYAKCGSLFDAQKVFQQLSTQDALSWSTLITGYFQHGQFGKGHDLLKQMLQAGMKPDSLMFTGILKGCGELFAVDQGRQIHSLLVGIGLDSDVVIGTSLIDMYCACQCLPDAVNVFQKLQKRDAILWNTMIGRYATAGQVDEAMGLLRQMGQCGIRANEVTFLNLLRGCQDVIFADHVTRIHACAKEYGLEEHGVVGSTLVDIYAKCGRLDKAWEVFNKLPSRSVVSWTAMIRGYVQHGHAKEALRLFKLMENTGVEPDKVTFVSVLQACSSTAALVAGQAIHLRLINACFDTDVFVGSTLIDMYARCGCLEAARDVFEKLAVKNVVSWNAIIGAYAQHGCAQEALDLMQQMQQEGIQPNDVTFVNVLTACSHAGLLPEGSMLFQSMCSEFSITPAIEHNACMVDLLCRSGFLQEAQDLMDQLPLQPDAMMWLSVLGACRTHGNVALGARSFEAIIRIDPGNSSAYTLMSRIYAEAGRLEEEAEIRKRMSLSCVVKEPGRTWMEFHNVVHCFMADDKEHTQRQIIDSFLTTLMRDMVGD